MSDAKVRFYSYSGDVRVPADKAVRFGFECPRGRGVCQGLLIAGRTGLIRNGNGQNGGHPMWDFDGNAEAPTFTPSIDCKVGGRPCWHGYIRAGRCVDVRGGDEPEPAR